LTLWGWDRHQWGSVHFILAIVLLVLLFFHIVFHWKEVKCLFRRLIPNFVLRIILTCLFVVVSLAFLFFGVILPFDAAPQDGGGGHHQNHGLHRAQTIQETTVHLSDKEHSSERRSHMHHHESQSDREETIQINGTMTLKQVGEMYQIHPDSIKHFLQIPVWQSSNEKLGRLRRKYHFHMSDIERYIEAYHQRKK